MLQMMLAYSKSQLVIAGVLLAFGVFLLATGRGAWPLFWGGNVGFLFLVAWGLWLFGAWLNARAAGRRS